MDQPPRPAPTLEPASRLRRVLVPPVLATACALLTAGCGEGGGEPGAGGATPRVTTAPSKTVQQLASEVGCTAEITVRAADYRQATCKTAEADYVFVDFDTSDGQRAWLDYAKMYGGIYLVGDRWALSAKSKEYMESVRATLGGTVEEQGASGAAPPPSGP
ncbi:hypothetical protein ACFV30_41250 [Streptomyces sp. NPDC059752]|uniref:hypothetical protein n=1 Tax=unclassified Streptomyces TaxID=2593676 RepID=UPI003647A853